MQRPIALLLLVAVASVHCHKLRFGPCKKNIPGAANFDPTALEGSWFVIKKTATSSSCMSVVFNNTGNGLEMREIRTPTSVTPFKIVLTNIGKLTQKGSDPAVMNLKWDNFLSPIISTTYTVLQVDGSSLLVDMECQDLFLARRESGTILARTKNVSAADIADAEKLLAAQGIDTGSMNVIDHSSCFDPTEVDYNIIVDEDGVRAGLTDEEGEPVKLIETPEELEELRKKYEGSR